MIDKNLLRVSIKGDLKWLTREELEAYVDALSPTPPDDTMQASDNKIIVDGVKAVVAAGCQRRRLKELIDEGILYIPPNNINPVDQISIHSEQRSLKECRTRINEFLTDHLQIETVTTPLSVTQLWWMRRQHDAMSSVLLEHGCALVFEHRHMTLYASSQQLLRQCQHRLLQFLIDFVDCKIRYSNCDANCEQVLQESHRGGCFAVWHDGVLEVQGGRSQVYLIVTGTSACTTNPCKLINVHPHADKDFICGKKDGKLLRIMREMSVQIDLRDATGDMLLQITTTGPSFEKAWRASGQVDDELPTVKTAHIPEYQHRRLIGQAGKNIQRIMKRHAVYIKFFGDVEAREEFGGCREWHMPPNVFANRNVVIKTPSKNGAACEASYEDILEECGLFEAPGLVKAAVPVDLEMVLKVVLERDQVMAFVGGRWTVHCYGSSRRVHYHTDIVANVNTETKETMETMETVQIAPKQDLFSLFPSAFSTNNTESTRVSVLEEGDEVVQNTLLAPAVGIIGDHKQEDADLEESIDDEIEVLMRNLRQANLGRRKSVTVFEL